jgi:glucuronoarabinoxylan endo-1,4-beta-xylanase
MSNHTLLRVALLLAGALLVTSAQAGDVRIQVDPEQRFQRIEGFGTCLYPHGDNYKTYEKPGFDRIYAEQLGLNIIRVNAQHFVCEPFENPQDVTWRDIVTERKSRIYTDFCKAVKKLNPDLRIIATVWTPPAWMKVNESQNSGRPRGQNRGIQASSYNVRRENVVSTNRVAEDKYEHFVAWMVAVAEYFQHEGIPLYGMSPANEPRFSQWYGSCIWTAKDFTTIIAMLGEGLEKAGHGEILLYGPEDMTGHLHSEGTTAFIKAMMDDSRARKQLDRFATHGYTDGVQADISAISSRKFWEIIRPYGKPYWMTEGGTGPHEWPAPVTKGAGIALHNSLVAGNASAFVPWQISGGRASGHNFMLRDQMTPKTRALLHFSRAVPTDGHRIAAEPGFGSVLASAYLREKDGRLGIVLINPTDEPHSVTLDLAKLGKVTKLDLYRTVDGESVDAEGPVRITGGSVKLAMPARSIASLRGVVAR